MEKTLEDTLPLKYRITLLSAYLPRPPSAQGPGRGETPSLQTQALQTHSPGSRPGSRPWFSPQICMTFPPRHSSSLSSALPPDHADAGLPPSCIKQGRNASLAAATTAEPLRGSPEHLPPCPQEARPVHRRFLPLQPLPQDGLCILLFTVKCDTAHGTQMRPHTGNGLRSFRLERQGLRRGACTWSSQHTGHRHNSEETENGEAPGPGGRWVSGRGRTPPVLSVLRPRAQHAGRSLVQETVVRDQPPHLHMAAALSPFSPTSGTTRTGGPPSVTLERRKGGSSTSSFHGPWVFPRMGSGDGRVLLGQNPQLTGGPQQTGSQRDGAARGSGRRHPASRECETEAGRPIPTILTVKEQLHPSPSSTAFGKSWGSTRPQHRLRDTCGMDRVGVLALKSG